MAKESVGPKSPFQEKYLNCNSNIIIAGGGFCCASLQSDLM